MKKRVMLILPIFVFPATLRLAAQTGPVVRASQAMPTALYQCEGDQCTRGGGGAVWLFEGSTGRAMWHYGAVASLTVRQYDGETIVIHREDPNPSYSSPRFADPTKRSDGVFFADYVGTIHGNRIDGTVVWNGGGKGTWYATIPEMVCQPFDQCPLDVGQLMQLGQNALKANLPTNAMQCFWAASRQGNADAQSVAGVMIRDGIGVRANSEAGLLLLKQSADQNNPNGELALAQSYELGLGVARDASEAAYWKAKAYRRIQELRAQQEQQQAQNQLGEFLVGAAVVGIIAAVLSSDGSGSDSSSRSSSPSQMDLVRRSEALHRENEWYAHGGGVAGPPATWQVGSATH